jgi:hypothetical protein
VLRLPLACNSLATAYNNPQGRLHRLTPSYSSFPYVPCVPRHSLPQIRGLCYELGLLSFTFTPSGPGVGQLLDPGGKLCVMGSVGAAPSLRSLMVGDLFAEARALPSLIGLGSILQVWACGVRCVPWLLDKQRCLCFHHLQSTRL